MKRSSATMRRVQVTKLVLDASGRSAAVAGGDVGQRVWLSPREFALCAALVNSDGAVCSHAALIGAVWGDDGTRRRLEVLTSRLRSRLRPIGIDVVGVHKRGYRLDEAPN